MRKNRSYSELIMIETFEDRFEYLRLGGVVGEETFGSDRYLNQILYGSQEWKDVRNDIIARDGGYDLGVEGVEIKGICVVHHINPITADDILNRRKCVFDPENLITTAGRTTHKAIHYGDASLLPQTKLITRSRNDTSPWLRQGGRNEHR